MLVQFFSYRKVIGHNCSTVPLKSSWCAFHMVQRYQHTFVSLISDSHTKDITHFSLGQKMYNSVVQHIAHHVEQQKISAQVHHSDVSGQSGSIARTARSRAGRDLSRQLQPKTSTHIQESNGFVQPYAPDSSNRVHFLGQSGCDEDDEGRSPHGRRVSGTHRVNLDWSFLKESISFFFTFLWDTNQQITDILRKGSFSRVVRNELMTLFGIVSESFNRSSPSVVATLVPCAHKMAKTSRHSREEDSGVSGASSKPNPEGNRAFALAAVRHQKKLTTDLCSRKDAVRCPEPGTPRPGFG